MVDLSTKYLGLTLKNPFVPSASPFTKDLDHALRLEDAGAAAIVMHSLFEEKIEAEVFHNARFFYQQAIGHGEADSFHPIPASIRSYQDQHLELLDTLKSKLSIPIIASLNGVSLSGWLDYGLALQQAGADALELNAYYIAANPDEDSAAVEHRYLAILSELKKHLRIPITLKLSPQFSSPIHFAKQLEQAGADGVVLFNRFYQPDIDLETLQIAPKLELSSPNEALLRVRWTALLYGRVKISLAVTGGFHGLPECLKALLAGANVVHLCSALLIRGPEHLQGLVKDLEQWLISHDYESITQLIGSVSQRHAIDPAAYERANYVQVLDNYSCPESVLR